MMVQWTNTAIQTGDYFAINLGVPPFSLMPRYVYSEDDPHFKHMYLYALEDLNKWDLDAVACRIEKGNWSEQAIATAASCQDGKVG